VDVASGNSIRKFEKIQDVVVSPDEKQAISLDADEITFWNLPSGSKEKSFSIAGAGNAISLSSDGKILAVSQLVNAVDFRSQFRKDKKGLKNTAKYKQIVSLFNAESGAKMMTIGEFYDIIYNLHFLPGSDILLVYQTPDVRIQINNKKLSYINLIDGKKLEPLRKGFTSMSIAQSDLKISDDNKLFAVNSKGTRFQEMHLYDYETGTLQKRFELGHRLFEKVDGEKLINGSRPAFIFLPDNQSILIAMGNQLIKWNLEFNTTE
jgi:WD40 repeat protein